MTGDAVELSNLREAKDAISGTSVFANISVNLDNVENILSAGDGAIIGTHFKVEGDIWKPVDGDRVKRFMDRVSGPR